MIFTLQQTIFDREDTAIGFNPLIQVNDFYKKEQEKKEAEKTSSFNPLIQVNDFY